ncbi:hypothetical protein DL93DRAFT_1693038 [Clavulina sp. PMI_390]|nr:hypothetical protein DL93DRAFT_1693038 [Clavulina sp. PMI_390]
MSVAPSITAYEISLTISWTTESCCLGVAYCCVRSHKSFMQLSRVCMCSLIWAFACMMVHAPLSTPTMTFAIGWTWKCSDIFILSTYLTQTNTYLCNQITKLEHSLYNCNRVWKCGKEVTLQWLNAAILIRGNVSCIHKLVTCRWTKCFSCLCNLDSSLLNSITSYCGRCAW